MIISNLMYQLAAKLGCRKKWRKRREILAAKMAGWKRRESNHAGGAASINEMAISPPSMKANVIVFWPAWRISCQCSWHQLIGYSISCVSSILGAIISALYKKQSKAKRKLQRLSAWRRNTKRQRKAIRKPSLRKLNITISAAAARRRKLQPKATARPISSWNAAAWNHHCSCWRLWRRISKAGNVSVRWHLSAGWLAYSAGIAGNGGWLSAWHLSWLCNLLLNASQLMALP